MTNFKIEFSPLILHRSIKMVRYIEMVEVCRQIYENVLKHLHRIFVVPSQGRTIHIISNAINYLEWYFSVLCDILSAHQIEPRATQVKYCNLTITTKHKKRKSKKRRTNRHKSVVVEMNKNSIKNTCPCILALLMFKIIEIIFQLAAKETTAKKELISLKQHHRKFNRDTKVMKRVTVNCGKCPKFKLKNIYISFNLRDGKNQEVCIKNRLMEIIRPRPQDHFNDF